MKTTSYILMLGSLLLSSIVHANTLENVPYSSLKSQPNRQPNQLISYGADTLQYGQLWLPHELNSQKPLVVFIHGGCWLNAYDIAHTNPASHALTQAGFPVWSLEYRRTGDSGGAWPGTFDDIMAGIKQAKQLKHPKLNNQQLILMGHSAGGHLAVLAGQQLKNDPQLKAVIGLAAITDIKKYAQGNNSCQTATAKFMGGDYKQQQAQYDLANPIKQGFHPNTLLIHGDHDNIVPLSQSINSKQKLITVTGAGHFDMIHSQTKAWQTLLTTLNEVTKRL